MCEVAVINFIPGVVGVGIPEFWEPDVNCVRGEPIVRKSLINKIFKNSVTLSVVWCELRSNCRVAGV